jgi:hypothetical protein
VLQVCMVHDAAAASAQAPPAGLTSVQAARLKWWEECLRKAGQRQVGDNLARVLQENARRWVQQEPWPAPCPLFPLPLTAVPAVVAPDRHAKTMQLHHWNWHSMEPTGSPATAATAPPDSPTCMNLGPTMCTRTIHLPSPPPSHSRHPLQHREWYSVEHLAALDYTTPDDLVRAARLAGRGKETCAQLGHPPNCTQCSTCHFCR